MNRIGLVLAIGVAVVGLPALADDIIYFTNGTSMPVTSHEIDGDTIRVNLNGSSTMAFPLEQIDRVEDAKGKVVSSRSGYNKAVSGVPEPSGGGQSANAPSRFKRGQWEGDVENPRAAAVDNDGRGGAVNRPYGDSEQAGKRKVTTAGNRSIFNQPPITNRKDGVIGTSRVGNKSVIARPGATRPTPMGIQQRPADDKN